MRNFSFTFAMALMPVIAVGQGPTSAKVQVLSLTVVEPNADGTIDLVKGSLGTTASLTIELPGKNIVNIYRTGSTATMTDDLGDELTAARKIPPGAKAEALADAALLASISNPILPSFEVSDDGHSIKLSVRADKTPAAGAKAIRIKGALTLACAAETKTVEVNGVTSDQKAKFKAEPFVVTFNKTPYGWMEEPEPVIGITWQGGQHIKSIVAISQTGEKTELVQTFSAAAVGGKLRIHAYSAKGLNGPQALRISYCEVERIAIPLDLTTSIPRE